MRPYWVSSVSISQTSISGTIRLIASGRISKTILLDDENLADVNAGLKSSIESYNSALANNHLHIDLKTYEFMKGTYNTTFIK
jgi:hypothetical protein